jgi:hypothetical protein
VHLSRAAWEPISVAFALTNPPLIRSSPCAKKILEKTKEFGIGTHNILIDYKAAYDSVRWEQLYDSMRDTNTPKN